MLRKTQIKTNFGKPTKTSADYRIKEWLLRSNVILSCPQMSNSKPCWNCKKWDGWIKQYKEGKLK